LLPNIVGPDAFWNAKRHPVGRGAESRLIELAVPKHTPLGFFVAFFMVILGFSMIWHIWWLAVVALLGAIAVCLRHAWRSELENYVSVETIAEHERAHQAQVARA
jgi:cytochrome o ubiquinol oxidase subunit 1